MKATWTRRKKGRRLPLSIAFGCAVLLGGAVEPDSVNPNLPSELNSIDTDEDLQLIVDEGRRQLDAQVNRLDRVNSRAQALLTAALVVLAFAASGFRRLERVHDATLVSCWALWVIALAGIVSGTTVAAAVMVVRADFDAIDTTQMSHWKPPLLHALANDYTKAVILGETTVAARITAFRQATRLVCWAAILTSLLWVITQ